MFDKDRRALRCTLLLLTLVLVGLLPARAGAQIFGPARDYSPLPISVAVGDVNGDGKQDIIEATMCVLPPGGSCAAGAGLAAPGSVGILLGNGDGTFQPVVSYSSGGLAAYSVAVGDVNRDGKLDVLVTNSCGGDSSCLEGSVAVLLGNGDGTFQSPVTYSSGGDHALSLALADLNGDGKLDIVVTNDCTDAPTCSLNAGGSLGVLLGNGDGTFQSPLTFATGAGPEAIAVGDMNGDGKPDLVVVNGAVLDKNPSSVQVFIGNGDGTFQSPVTYLSGGDYALSLALADLNNDGKLDVAVSNQCALNCPSNQGFVSVLLGNGDGTLQAPMVYSSGGENALSVAVADVDGDGNLDLVVGNLGGLTYGPDGLAVLLGNGDGTFRPAVDYGGPSPGISDIVSLVIGDLTGNLKPDVVAGGFALGVLLNISPYYRITVSGSPQQPVGKNSRGDFVADVTITNSGNVPIKSLQVTIEGTTLGSGSLLTAPAPVTNLAPGASATVTLTFPSNSVPAGATVAPLRVSGTYSVVIPSLSGNWALSFRRVTL